ncbi:hypothetical protein NEDG_00846 [Nematocida displodere]|uniref:C3H1-type domain-containing protein n=1 Tax=Nematocida displodere TaxID=1805483 RepID=A0A177ECN1_9MICR|nr:hypothetical protein NEDG_00846 [Nematocida displodere]
MEDIQGYGIGGSRPNERIPEVDKNLRFYLRKEIPKLSSFSPDEVIDKLEELSRESHPDPRLVLTTTFEPVFQNNIGAFVGKLLGYQKRPCRDNGNCRRPGCYFSHQAVDENVMEVDERPFHGREGREARDPRKEQSRLLIDKQRRLIEILSQRSDLPEDLLPIVDQLHKITQRIRSPYHSAETKARFIINNRQKWMTNEHLSTYPGVLSISETGVIECASRQDAERVIRMICKGDSAAKPTFIQS